MLKNPRLVAVLASLLIAIAACRDTDTTALNSDAVASRDEPESAQQPVVLAGRALAANCFQCHGTNGEASELKIAGIGASALREKFREMRSEHPGRNIMNVHAFAYTDDQISLIGDYFSRQGH